MKILLLFYYDKEDSPNNTKEENPNIVSQLVGKEADQGGSNEDTERQDGIPDIISWVKLWMAHRGEIFSLGVSRTIYINADAPKQGFSCLIFWV